MSGRKRSGKSRDGADLPRGISRNLKGTRGGFIARTTVIENGERKRKQSIFDTVPEAVKWMAQEKGNTLELSPPTLFEAITELLQPEIETDGSADYYNHHLQPAIEYFRPDRRLDTIRRVDVRAYLMRERDKGLGKRTLGMRKQVLGRVFNVALDWERIEHNPVTAVKPGFLKGHRPKQYPYAPRDELLELIEIVRHYKSELRSHPPMQGRDADLFLIAFGRGIRPAELSRICPEGVDLAGKTLTFRWKTGGSDCPILIDEDSLAVPESEYLAALDRAMRDSRPAEPLFSGDPRARTRTWRKNLELGEFPPYMLRHSYCMAKIDDGASIYELRDLMRHQHFSTTDRYYHSKAGQARLRKAKLWLRPEDRDRALGRAGLAGRSRPAPTQPSNACHSRTDSEEGIR